MKIQEIRDIFDELFKDIKVKSVKTVYEQSEENFKLVISIHNIIDETIIAHTKFIFLVDSSKNHTINNTFSYLYDMNCIYRKIDYKDSYIDLKESIEKIIKTKDFGKDFKNLNRFISDTPITNINNELGKSDITAISIFSFTYNPKFKICACDETTYDFAISLSNGFEITLVISKKEMFIFTYKLLELTKSFEYEDISNLSTKISSTLITILEEVL